MAGESCTHKVTDAPSMDLGTQVSEYPASERDSAHPGLGVPWGEGWCGETRRVTHMCVTPQGGAQAEHRQRTDGHTLLLVLSLAGRAGNKELMEKLERMLRGGSRCRETPRLGILI